MQNWRGWTNEDRMSSFTYFNDVSPEVYALNIILLAAASIVTAVLSIPFSPLHWRQVMH